LRRTVIFCLTIFLGVCSLAAQAPPTPRTDLDAFMEQALRRRDVDRKTLNDYVLDEVESFELLGPGRAPLMRMRREYTWFVQDGIHVRSPLKYDGVPIPEAERREYERKWIHSEQQRRKFRTERDAKRASEGKPPALNSPSVNEPRFVAESYFMDFKFEPGNYYLAGREQLDGHDVLKIDYVPTRLFADEPNDRNEHRRPANEKPPKKKSSKEEEFDADIERKMNKSSQVTLWVDPESHQIVKYTFDNVWLDFLPAKYMVKIDDLRASMEMGQPFEGVWLPRNINIHAGITMAFGSVEGAYRREFSNYRRADVTSKVTVPKKDNR
jgi:hypothetical protein